ncbi:MAG: hypothetical protein K6F05_00050 [Succinivibrio sp.]|nr:hypothetical protein [Succinivibrio sp.]
MSATARMMALFIVLACTCLCSCQSPTEETKQLYWTAESASPAAVQTDSKALRQPETYEVKRG